jgi:Na+-translocating ferredoxin:NAD+ oxidoreductase subunit G
MNTPPALKSNGPYLRAILGLLLITGATTLAVSWMEMSTRSAVNANERAHKFAILASVLPADSYDNRPEQDVSMMIDRELLGSDSAQPIYSARAKGQVVTSVLTVTAPDGYVGPIQLLIGINRDGSITGVRVIRHKETPGLGDFIDTNKSRWIEVFSGRGPNADGADLTLRKDGGTIDHVTGATITSRAVTNAVANALQFHSKNRSALLAPDVTAAEAAATP